MELFNQTSLKCSREVTQAYSTSFSLAVSMLDRKFRDPIYAIYGFVRLADEIVDSFYGFDQAKLLHQLRLDLFQAIGDRISTNPLLHSFQGVVNQYGIEREVVEAFMDSMAMDLNKTRYSEVEFRDYVYGSAEAVGLMCLRVFCEGREDLYQRLKFPARKLGEAFQKVNFLRDIREDFHFRGRMYFPGIDLEYFNNASKRKLEDDIARDFQEAVAGIGLLPDGARQGVALAYRYYLVLFEKIKAADAKKVASKRFRVSPFRKAVILSNGFMRQALGLL